MAVERRETTDYEEPEAQIFEATIDGILVRGFILRTGREYSGTFVTITPSEERDPRSDVRSNTVSKIQIQGVEYIDALITLGGQFKGKEVGVRVPNTGTGIVNAYAGRRSIVPQDWETVSPDVASFVRSLSDQIRPVEGTGALGFKLSVVAGCLERVPLKVVEV